MDKKRFHFNDYYSSRTWKIFIIPVIVLSLMLEIWQNNNGPEILDFILMWIPGLSAMAATYFGLKKNGETFHLRTFFRKVGVRGCKPTYVLLGILIPLLYILIPYLIYWKIHPESYKYLNVSMITVIKDIGPIMVTGIFFKAMSALGEEIGWRGYMLPYLTEKYDLKKAIIIVSLFWAGWHFPVLIGGDYMAGAPLWYKLSAFTFCVAGIGVITAILTYQAKSIWPAVFLHAAHNNFDQMVFGAITSGTDKMYYVSETGILTIICVWIFAFLLIVWLKRDSQ